MSIKKEYIKAWCENALRPVKNINNNAPSSYGLKHICEQSIGVYVSNDEFKEVMKELKFKHTKGINHNYNISKIIDRVVFSKKLGNLYDDSCRGFHHKSKTIQL